MDIVDAASYDVDDVRSTLTRCLDSRVGMTASARAEVSGICGWFDRLGADKVARLPEIAGQLAEVEFCLERYADAARHFDRAIESAAAAGRLDLLARLLISRSRTHNAVGRLDAADTDLTAVGQLDVAPHVTAMLDTMHSMVSLWRFGPARTELPAKTARLTEPVPAWRDTTVMALAHLWSVQARLGDAARLLEDAVAGPVPRNEVGWRLPNWLGGVAESLVATEGPVVARPWADRAILTAARLGLPGCRSRAAMSTAVVLLADGDAATALNLALAAVDDMALAGRRLWLGEAYLLAGQASHAVGEAIAADALLGRARAIGVAGGAGWIVRKVADERRTIGARRPRPRRGGMPSRPFGMTERERQVARLAAVGLTNKQIGDRLFISGRTVETHLSRVFRKVGVASRAALGLRLAEEGDRPPPVP